MDLYGPRPGDGAGSDRGAGRRSPGRWSCCCTAASGARPTTAAICRRWPPRWPGRAAGRPRRVPQGRRGGGAPRTFEDVAAAVEAAADGRRREVVLVGHSAGGHLALLAAARPGTPVRRVIAVSPVADLARAHELGLSDGAVAELLGPGPGFAARLAAADPVRRPPVGVPVTILHGTDDPDVPPDLSRRYAAASPATTTLRELPGVGHYAPVTPGTAGFAALLSLLRPPRST
ncbi:alpha/beta fold hydrolase [Streptomyces lydicus]|nr:alpha/beta fold hydrolase [Streptomyces lydicus]